MIYHEGSRGMHFNCFKNEDFFLPKRKKVKTFIVWRLLSYWFQWGILLEGSESWPNLFTKVPFEDDFLFLNLIWFWFKFSNIVKCIKNIKKKKKKKKGEREGMDYICQMPLDKIVDSNKYKG